MININLNECINSWLEQYDRLSFELNKILQTYSNIQDVINVLSKQYVAVTTNKAGNRAYIPLLKNGHKMIVSVGIDKNKNIVLSDMSECWFTPGQSRKCHVSKLRDTDYRIFIDMDFGRYFVKDEDLYAIQVYDLTKDRSEYKIHYRHDKNEALKFAKEEQERLSVCKQCFCLTIHKGSIEHKSYNVTIEPESCYTLSTKSKKETKLEIRKNLRFEFRVDEYFSGKSSKSEAIAVMSIVKLDKDGNLKNDIQYYNSKDDARKAAQEIIEQWMTEKHFTSDEYVYEKSHDYYELCEKRDFGNSIKINCIHNIAELNIQIVEIDI